MSDPIVHQQILDAHKNVFTNKEEVLASSLCGCFHCLSKFKPEEVTEWGDRGQSAICPKCKTDSVLGNKSGFSLDRRFLKKMKEFWFKKIPVTADY